MKVYTGRNISLYVNGQEIEGVIKVTYRLLADRTATLEILKFGPDKFFTSLFGAQDVPVELGHSKDFDTDHIIFPDCTLLEINNDTQQNEETIERRTTRHSHHLIIQRMSKWWQRPKYNVSFEEQSDGNTIHKSQSTSEIIETINIIFKAQSFRHY